MIINRYVKIFLGCICICIWLIAGNTAALGASADEPQAGTDSADESIERYVTIDFENVDINLFINHLP